MRDWIPVRNGDTYCSPACDLGCKFKAFEKATKEAEELASRMGNGWETRVWESCGWHYDIHCGAARITPDFKALRGTNGKWQGTGSSKGNWVTVGYTCWLASNLISPQVIEHAETPEMALGLAMQKARWQIQKAHEALATIYGETDQ